MAETGSGCSSPDDDEFVRIGLAALTAGTERIVVVQAVEPAAQFLRLQSTRVQTLMSK